MVRSQQKPTLVFEDGSCMIGHYGTTPMVPSYRRCIQYETVTFCEQARAPRLRERLLAPLRAAHFLRVAHFPHELGSVFFFYIGDDAIGHFSEASIEENTLCLGVCLFFNSNIA